MINHKLMEMARAHKRCTIMLCHWDHENSDGWSTSFKCEEAGTTIEFRESGDSPHQVVERLHSKWKKLRDGIVPDVFLPALEAPVSWDSRAQADLNDEVPF